MRSLLTRLLILFGLNLLYSTHVWPDHLSILGFPEDPTIPPHRVVGVFYSWTSCGDQDTSTSLDEAFSQVEQSLIGCASQSGFALKPERIIRYSHFLGSILGVPGDPCGASVSMPTGGCADGGVYRDVLLAKCASTSDLACDISNFELVAVWRGSIRIATYIDHIRENETYSVRLFDPNHAISSSSPSVVSTVEPERASVLIATVYDQSNRPVPNVSIELTVEVRERSGGHEHPNDGRPRGSIGGPPPTPHVVTGTTGPNGEGFTVTFTAPAIAGDHPITARCTDGKTCTQEGPDTVWVGIKDLHPLQVDPSYVLIRPNADRNHPANHYVSEPTQRKIRSLVADYHNTWFPNDPLLHLNDASLVRGGLFDLGANWSPQPRGHRTHRFGTDIDVRANEFYHDPSQSIPTSNYVDLMNTIAPDHGCNAQVHSGATPNEHFHLYCR